MSAQNPNTNYNQSLNVPVSPIQSPSPNLAEGEVNQLRGEIEKLKRSVNELSSR